MVWVLMLRIQAAYLMPISDDKFARVCMCCAMLFYAISIHGLHTVPCALHSHLSESFEKQMSFYKDTPL